MTTIPPDAGRSWWLREALADDPGEPAPPLRGDLTADVVILGGGYTGMWTALQLKELDPGIDIAILEADIVGGGASGRNGGFVNSFWGDLEYLARHFGDRAAVALCEAGEESVKAIGRFASDEGIDAWYRADGEYVVAASEEQIGRWADGVITADRLGVSEHFQVLSAEELRERISSPVFRGALYRKVGATVHPGRLARGMRRVLLERGVRIYEDTPVTRFGAGDPARAETPGGTVRAGAAVVALNAWAHHWKRFRRTVVVRGSYIVMTEPAPERLKEIGWTDGSGVADMRSAIHYVRTTPDGRISFGLGGMQPNLARRIGPRFAYDPAAIADRDRGPPSDVPRVRRGADRGRVGRSDRRLGPPPARRSERSDAGTSTTDTATPATAWDRRTSADGSSRDGSSGRPIRSSTCRSWTSSRCGSHRSRCVHRARSSRTRRSAARTKPRTTAMTRTRSSTSSRSSPGASATTSVPRHGNGS